ADSIDIVKSDLDTMMKHNPDKIVLGCTHYPFLIDILSEFVDRSLFIDPAVPFAEFIKTDLEDNNLLNTSNNNASEEFYVSSDPAKFKLASKMFCELAEEPKLLTF
ncbi:hypothetical protein HDR58_09635, partial [bacterium]|nr:hypothetical protein [bacterium]